jgi:hypothetical protein
LGSGGSNVGLRFSRRVRQGILSHRCTFLKEHQIKSIQMGIFDFLNKDLHVVSFLSSIEFDGAFVVFFIFR